MAFTLLPAADVAHGRVARLPADTRHPAAGTNVALPLDLARNWQAQGAEWIHLVDLDAAHGRGSNIPALAAIVGGLDVPVQLSGGVHDDASPDRALATGSARALLAPAALDAVLVGDP